MAPVVVVHGSTGLQGGSIIRTLSAQGGYAIRAIVRDTGADKAKALATLPGVELAKAGLDKESLTKAYSGADFVYACTPLDPTEEDQGKAMADAAAAAKVKLFIWSTLESAEEKSGGTIPVHHFDAKARVSKYIHELGIPAVYVYLGAFFDNFINYGGLKAGEDGTLILCHMGVKLATRVPQVAIKQDLGHAVDVIVKNKDAFVGKSVYLAPFSPTPPEQAALVEKYTGKKTVAVEVDYPPTMAEFGAMTNYFEKYGLYKDQTFPDPLLEAHGFKPTSFEEFVKKEIVPLF